MHGELYTFTMTGNPQHTVYSKSILRSSLSEWLKMGLPVSTYIPFGRSIPVREYRPLRQCKAPAACCAEITEWGCK